ncbi:MAG: hypothetical protein ACYTGR_12560, partial [Planctomycetota bacterium]
QIRCLTLVPDGMPISALLQSGLRDRGWSLVVRTNPADAMADLCMRERLERARAAWGLVRGIRTVLLIVCPAHWPAADLVGLRRAVRTYLPDVTTVTFEHGRIHDGPAAGIGVTARETTVVRTNGDARPTPHVRLTATCEAGDTPTGRRRPSAATSIDRLEAQRARRRRRLTMLDEAWPMHFEQLTSHEASSPVNDENLLRGTSPERMVTREELDMLLGTVE